MTIDDVAFGLRPAVANLPAYDPGADPNEVATTSGMARVIKLSNNENPYGASPRVLEAVARYGETLYRYPDPAGKLLKQAIGDRLDVPPERIVLGNGSENILELVTQAVVETDDLVVTQTPGFSLHDIFPRVAGARIQKIPVTEDFDFDIEAWLDVLANRPRLVFLANPCNPTGAIVNRDHLDRLIAATPASTLLVVDEAYYEFARSNPDYPDALDLLRGTDLQWVVLRTFSKAYGIAALRVGYAIAANTELVSALDRIRTPYNVNQMAQNAAVAALADSDHLAYTVSRTVAEIGRVSTALRARGFPVVESSSNFMFIDTGRSADWVVEQLHRNGIILKGWREPGYETYVRASLSTAEDNDTFVDILTELCGDHQ